MKGGGGVALMFEYKSIYHVSQPWGALESSTRIDYSIDMIIILGDVLTSLLLRW
jgi:hypothetical protein